MFLTKTIAAGNRARSLTLSLHGEGQERGRQAYFTLYLIGEGTKLVGPRAKPVR